jgi:HK97 family phage portal protein
MIAEAINRLIPRAAKSALDDFWYAPAGSQSTSGTSVTVDVALAVASVFACVRLIAESLASCPFRVHKKTGKSKSGRKVADDYWLDKLLYERPNMRQTPMEFVDCIVTHVLLCGNFYALQVKIRDERVLTVLRPDWMRVNDAPYDRYSYEYHKPTGEVITYQADSIFHVKAMGGLSVLQFAKDAIGMAKSQETHGASLFKNGGLPPLWIARKEGIAWGRDGKENFRKSWRRIVGGAENAGSPPILEDGMTLNGVPINNEELQWIESQGFSGAQICRFFRVPPWMIGLDKPPTDTEQAMLQFTKLTLRPWAVRLESAADVQLVDDSAYYTKIWLDEIQKADILTRSQANNIGVQGGWKTRNEARVEDDYDPLPGLDEPLEALNMQPAGGGADWNEQGGQPGKGRPVRRRKADEEAVSDDEALKDAQSDGAIIAPLLRDAAQRLSSAELRGLASRAEKSAGDAIRWPLALREFYRAHGDYVRRTVAPISQCWQATGHAAVDSSVIVSAIETMAEPLYFGAVPVILKQMQASHAANVRTILYTAFGILEESNAPEHS